VTQPETPSQDLPARFEKTTKTLIEDKKLASSGM
jgi:hypothetical protein